MRVGVVVAVALVVLMAQNVSAFVNTKDMKVITQKVGATPGDRAGTIDTGDDFNLNISFIPYGASINGTSITLEVSVDGIVYHSQEQNNVDLVEGTRYYLPLLDSNNLRDENDNYVWRENLKSYECMEDVSIETSITGDDISDATAEDTFTIRGQKGGLSISMSPTQPLNNETITIHVNNDNGNNVGSTSVKMTWIDDNSAGEWETDDKASTKSTNSGGDALFKTISSIMSKNAYGTFQVDAYKTNYCKGTTNVQIFKYNTSSSVNPTPGQPVTELQACYSNVSYYKNMLLNAGGSDVQAEYTKCQVMLASEQQLTSNLVAQAGNLTSERDNTKGELVKCQVSVAEADNTCNNKTKPIQDNLNVLTDQTLQCKSALSETQNLLAIANVNLNLTTAKVTGTCNEYLASNYYKLWTQLTDDQKTCLSEVLKRDRVAFLTTDTKESIMIMCSLNWNYAVSYLQKFEELGFIEKDTTGPAFQIDPNLATDAQKYLSLAGYFRPIDMSRGCTQRFRDMDKYYLDGKNWGAELTLFWVCLFLAIYIKGSAIGRRVLRSY